MGKKELCPCGSGKSRQHCCGDQPAATAAKFKKVAIWGGIFIVAGVMTTITLSLDTAPTTTPNANAASATGGTPSPWEYNPITNQHWDPRPGHEHWHVGPPPSDPNSLASPPAATPINPLDAPGDSAYQHLEYDPINNRHWFAGEGHNHWHDGPPPSGIPTTGNSTGNAPVPVPIEEGDLPINRNRQHLEYDAINNRHWFAGEGHNHWHDGPPPGGP